MPDLNLHDEDEFSDRPENDDNNEGYGDQEDPAEPADQDDYEDHDEPAYYDRGGGNSNKILLIAIAVLIVLGVVMMNQFGIINLWGSGDSRVVVDLPPLEEEEVVPIPEPGDLLPSAMDETELPAEAEHTEETAETAVRTAPAERAAPRAVQPEVRTPATRPEPERREVRTSPTGRYTVQASSWRDRQIAENQVRRIRNAGEDAFIDEAVIDGTTWYRVRVGRYETQEDATEDARRFRHLLDSGWWVARIYN